MNPLMNQLQPYPFARLREAMQGVQPPLALGRVGVALGNGDADVSPFHVGGSLFL